MKSIPCNECKQDICFEFDSDEQEARFLRKIGRQAIYCKFCAKEKHQFNIIGYKKKYVTHEEIRKQKIRLAEGKQQIGLDAWI